MNEIKLEECRGAADFTQAIASIDSRLRELDEEADGQQFNESQRAEFDTLAETREKASAALAEVEARAAYLAKLAGNPENVTKTYSPPNIRKSPEDIYDMARYSQMEPERRSQALRDGGMRALEKIRFGIPNVDQARAQEGVEKLLDRDLTGAFANQILVTDAPAYKRAFHKYLTQTPGVPLMLTKEEERGTALAMQVTTTGGFAVPPSYDLTMIHTGAWTAINPVRATARVEQITGGQNTWKGLSAGAVTATRADEAAVTTEQGPTLAQPSISPTKVQGQITFSVETGDDWTNLENDMASLIYEAKDTEEEAIFSTGAGGALGSLTQPIGISPAHGTAGAFAHVACAADGTFAIGDIDTVYGTLALRHRGRAVWFMSRPILGTVQGFETTGGRLFGAQGGYPAVGQTSATPNTGDTGLRVLGRPVYEHPSGAADATDGANKFLLVLADMSQYVIVDRVGMTVELVPHIFGAGQGNLVTGQRALYFYYRNSAKPINTSGGCILYHQA